MSDTCHFFKCASVTHETAVDVILLLGNSLTYEIRFRQARAYKPQVLSQQILPVLLSPCASVLKTGATSLSQRGAVKMN